MEDLVTTKFFGFFPEKFYTEIYAIGHNEYIKAVSTLKETLLQDFPDKREEIETNCSKLLDRYNKDYDQSWFKSFFTYCSKNIFTIKENVPVYRPEMEAAEENKQAHAKSLNLRHCIMATEYLNVQLLGKVRQLDIETERARELLEKVVKTEQKLELVKRAQELEQRLVAVPDQPLEL